MQIEITRRMQSLAPVDGPLPQDWAERVARGEHIPTYRSAMHDVTATLSDEHSASSYGLFVLVYDGVPLAAGQSHKGLQSREFVAAALDTGQVAQLAGEAGVRAARAYLGE